MAGPKPIFASGRRRRTAVASTCAPEWRSTWSARGSLSVITTNFPTFGGGGGGEGGRRRMFVVGYHDALPTLSERRGEVEDLAVHGHGDRSQQQARPYGGDHVARQRARPDLSGGSVRQDEA